MFNILLMVAGVLEYALLGIDYHVGQMFNLISSFTEPFKPGQLPKHLSRRHLDLSGFHQCFDRLLPDPEVGSDLGLISGNDSPFMPRRA